MSGEITVRSRPLRLAFFIPPTKSAFLQAVRVNSTLWGGFNNPIIPLYVRPQPNWRTYPRQKLSVPDRVLGYVRAFDPDVLINCGDGKLPAYLSALQRRVVPSQDIWQKEFLRDGDLAPKIGVGIFEILKGIHEELFKYKLRNPVQVILPSFGRQFAAFWAAAVGEMPERHRQCILEKYPKFIDLGTPQVDENSYATLLDSPDLFPRRLCGFRLQEESVLHRGAHNARAFFMDANNLADLVDFWNLRAIGRPVLPIPKQFLASPAYVELIRDFIRRSYQVNRANPSITHGTNIIRSFSSKMEELQALSLSLRLSELIPGKPEARTVSLQHWYPRIWDEWASGRDSALPIFNFAEEKSVDVRSSEEEVSLSVVTPDFVSDRYSEAPRYANDIFPSVYDNGGTPLANILPYEHGDHVLRAAGVPIARSGAFRIGRGGLVRLVSTGRRAHWKMPVAEDVFFGWLRDKGFAPQLSTCGRLAKQMNAQLNGWLYPLTDEPLLKLLESMNAGGEDGKGLALGHVKKAIAEIDPHGLYSSLVSRGMFQAGYKTQCVHCQRSSWYSLKSLAADLVCPLCQRVLDPVAAIDTDQKGQWHLKPVGPFSVANYGDGGYCVLLSLQFLQGVHARQLTPVFSFTTKPTSGGAELEADLGAFWQDTVDGDKQDGVIFAECKSYNRFEEKDFRRMAMLAENFPGAILAFCTLKRTFSAEEIMGIKKLARAGMKNWVRERPVNPVLVLTGRELFSKYGAPHCWEGDELVPAWAHRSYSLIDFCNATQAIYLGLPHWNEHLHAEFTKKQAKRAAKK